MSSFLDISSFGVDVLFPGERSNPAYHSVMPMRTPTSWSEALLNAAPKLPRHTVEEVNVQTIPHAPPIPRNMHDSYSELILPFGSSSQLIEEYINASGGIRHGKSVKDEYPSLGLD